MNELDALDNALNACTGAPADTRPELTDLGQRLYEAAYVARVAGFGDEVNRRLNAALEACPEHAKTSLQLAYLRENDVEFVNHGTQALDFRRVDFEGRSVAIDGMDVTWTATEAGAFEPVFAGAGESRNITLGCELQVFVYNELKEPEATRLHERGFDHSGLGGPIEFEYALRLRRRIAWGASVLALSDRRLVGVIFDEDLPGVKKSAERIAMPFAMFTAEDQYSESIFGSLMFFSIDASAFESYEISTGFMQSRLPAIHLCGDCYLVIHTHRVLGAGGKMEKPAKGAIAETVRAFMAPDRPGPEIARPQMTTCSSCGAPAGESDGFCSGCGSELASPGVTRPVTTRQTCPQCDEAVGANDRFCGECGSQLGFVTP